MKKVVIWVTAFVACLVIGMSSMATAADTTKVKSKVSISYQGASGPYGQAAFTGKVKGGKGCKKNRKVQIKRVGKAKTSSNGKYSIGASSYASGKYTAKVKKKKIKKNGTTIICKRAKASVTV